MEQREKAYSIISVGIITPNTCRSCPVKHPVYSYQDESPCVPILVLSANDCLNFPLFHRLCRKYPMR